MRNKIVKKCITIIGYSGLLLIVGFVFHTNQYSTNKPSIMNSDSNGTTSQIVHQDHKSHKPLRKKSVASSGQSSVSMMRISSYDLLNHSDAKKLRQQLKDDKKNNKSIDSCSLKYTQLHPYHEQIKLTALASFPRSGNTWLRTLIEKSTGYQTSSVYCDGYLKTLRAECDRSNRFLMKTHIDHSAIRVKGKLVYYNQFIYLVRNPFDAFASYHYYRLSGHHTKKKAAFHKTNVTAQNSATAFLPMTLIESSVKYYNSRFKYWSNIKLPHMVIRYEDLKTSPEIILRYVRLFLVPIPLGNASSADKQASLNFMYYFDDPPAFSVVSQNLTQFIEARDENIICAVMQDELGQDFVYKSNKYALLHSLKYYSNSSIDYIIRELREALCHFHYDILFKDQLNIPCDR